MISFHRFQELSTSPSQTPVRDTGQWDSRIHHLFLPFYRYLKLPFGSKIDKCFEWMPGVAAIVDDILVYGKTPQEKNTKLTRVLDKCRSACIKRNKDQLQVIVQEVEYETWNPFPTSLHFKKSWMWSPSSPHKTLPTSLVHFASCCLRTQFVWDTPQTQGQGPFNQNTRSPSYLLWHQ